MRVTIKLFAILRDHAGVGKFPVELPEGATVAHARATVVERFPLTRELMNRCRAAVNLSYEGVDTVLRDGDELAFIPPVSGG